MIYSIVSNAKMGEIAEKGGSTSMTGLYFDWTPVIINDWFKLERREQYKKIR